MTSGVLFVCLGNICRSPTAEAVFRDRAAREGLVVYCDSAGTSDWHIGDSPHVPAISAARGRGIDMTALRARQLSSIDFARFELILGMDESNLTAIERQNSPGSRAKNGTPFGLRARNCHSRSA